MLYFIIAVSILSSAASERNRNGDVAPNLGGSRLLIRRTVNQWSTHILLPILRDKTLQCLWIESVRKAKVL